MRKIKRAGAWLLAAALCVTMLAGTALAFDSDAFREQHGDALLAKGVHLYGVHEFREGLMPVLVRNDWNYALDTDWVPETVWNYIDENFNVVDLNKGRFTYVFPFFEGLAAVIGDDGVGYIDKTGKIVIPCGFSTYDVMGTVYTGYFKDGTAPVLKEHVNADPFSDNVPIYQVGRIDRTGKLVQAYTVMDALAGQNFISDVGDRLDTAQLPEEPTADYSFKVTRVKPEFYSKDDNGDYILDNGASYGITFTNNTAAPLTREIAFVSYGKKLNEYAHLDAQIHYVSLNMAAHGTQAVNISSEFTRLSGGDYGFAVVDFDDAADKRSFQSSVPMMANSDRAIDNSSKGIQWMRDTLGVTVK